MFSKRDNKGFTIIEVLIVLAIAGLMLIIVFLAVPALQRNSRNQGVKADASNALGGVTDFAAANNGLLPTQFVVACDNSIADCNLTRAAGNPTPAEFKKNGATTVTISAAAASWAANAVKSNTGLVHLVINAGCTGNTLVVGQSRSTAAQFFVETGTGNTAVALQCVQG